MEKIGAIKEKAKKFFSPYYIYCLIIVMINSALISMQWGLIYYGLIAFQFAGQYLLMQFLMTLSVLLGFFISAPIAVGVKSFFLNLVRGEAEMKDILSPFKKAYDRVIVIMFLRKIKIFLWSFLLVVPGIYKAYEYAMIPYIMAEEPAVSSKEAFKRSKKLMEGNRLNLFKLQISFIGWYVLASIPIFAGFMFLSPYVQTANAVFYEQIKKGC